jgi:hypothetical protein
MHLEFWRFGEHFLSKSRVAEVVFHEQHSFHDDLPCGSFDVLADLCRLSNIDNYKLIYLVIHGSSLFDKRFKKNGIELITVPPTSNGT